MHDSPYCDSKDDYSDNGLFVFLTSCPAVQAQRFFDLCSRDFAIVKPLDIVCRALAI